MHQFSCLGGEIIHRNQVKTTDLPFMIVGDKGEFITNIHLCLLSDIFRDEDLTPGINGKNCLNLR